MNTPSKSYCSQASVTADVHFSRPHCVLKP